MEKITTLAELQTNLLSVDLSTATMSELRDLPNFHVGQINDIFNITEKDAEVYSMWSYMFQQLPPLKKFKWGDLLKHRKGNKEFTGWGATGSHSHAYNQFIHQGYPCPEPPNPDKPHHMGFGFKVNDECIDIRTLTDIGDTYPEEYLSSVVYHSTKAHWLIQSIQKEGLRSAIQGFTSKRAGEDFWQIVIHPGSVRSAVFEEMENPDMELLVWDNCGVLEDLPSLTLDECLEYWRTALTVSEKESQGHMSAICCNGVIEWQPALIDLDFRSEVYAHGKKVHDLSKGKPLNIYIGYDSTMDDLDKICEHSILEGIRRALPQGDIMPYCGLTPEIKLLDISKLPDYNREYANQSTEFTYSRFLIPYLENYEGFSIFLDNDFIFKKNILPLFFYLNPDDAVACIQYPHYEHDTTKFDGEVNIDYPCKLWSSLMVFNNGHEDCKKLTPEVVNTWTGKQLHQFEWTDAISPIPQKYIFVEGYDDPEEKWDYSGIHYTRGGPWIKGMDTNDINNLDDYYSSKNLYSKSK